MQPDQPADSMQRFVEMAMRAEDQALLDAVLAGAAQDPPCGVRVWRKLGGPTQIAVNATIPPWEVHELRHGDLQVERWLQEHGGGDHAA